MSAVETDTNLEAKSCRSVVEECYSHWNRWDMKQAAACFAKEFTYDDGQFLGSIQNDKSQLAARFELGKSLLPPNSVLVVDSLAVCPSTGKIGTRWHVEDEKQRTLPRTRGCSFYTVDASSGLLRTGFRVSEMLVKPSKDMANGLVSSASKLLESSSPSPRTLETPRSSPPASVIEAYFRAWNARDMDAALDCFVDDCVYETEDPVFGDELEGKESLRKHWKRTQRLCPQPARLFWTTWRSIPCGGRPVSSGTWRRGVCPFRISGDAPCTQWIATTTTTTVPACCNPALMSRKPPSSYRGRSARHC